MTSEPVKRARRLLLASARCAHPGVKACNVTMLLARLWALPGVTAATESSPVISSNPFDERASLDETIQAAHEKALSENGRF
ncbi:hypothetical protein [Pseudohalioglobus lutimaris]|uniref:hypothetical protein n=1 Tax=Pseudohalioglobus lutimaris TaxID=1737061 RepID=UPI0010553D98|nr:hypothetical protein [Pseudohalioglobus lutimaris]